ncbi:unnamed protein product, partial [Polarella glacialis]
VTASQEPEAMAEANENTVRATFDTETFVLKIKGKTTDFVLRRRAGPRGAMRGGDLLPIGFLLCPERCSLVVSPGKKIELTLRPNPEEWLPAGTRVRIHGLKGASELNGALGS